MKRKLTAKEKVLRVYPGAAYCWWMRAARIEIRSATFRLLGEGATANEAWADAAARLGRRKP